MKKNNEKNKNVGGKNEEKPTAQHFLNNLVKHSLSQGLKPTYIRI